MGADVNGIESFGTTTSGRLCKTAEEVLPLYNWGLEKVHTNSIVTNELREDLSRIFLLLKMYNTDFDKMIEYYSRAIKHYMNEFLILVKEERLWKLLLFVEAWSFKMK